MVFADGQEAARLKVTVSAAPKAAIEPPAVDNEAGIGRCGGRLEHIGRIDEWCGEANAGKAWRQRGRQGR